MPSAIAAVIATSAGTGNVGVYSAIAVSACVDIVCEWVANVAKDVQAMDCQLNEFKDFLNKIRDEFAFLRHSVIALVYNAGLLDIK